MISCGVITLRHRERLLRRYGTVVGPRRFSTRKQT